jgi:hypothetical protein
MQQDIASLRRYSKNLEIKNPSAIQKQYWWIFSHITVLGM